MESVHNGECMIFAAGLGTRLQNFTQNKPKALVEVNGKTLLELNLNKLISSGFKHIVINVHAFAQQIVDFVNNSHFDADIFISDESEALLDTGGGLQKALPLFSGEKPILLHNVDVLSQINLSDLYKQHIFQNADATLSVSDRQTMRYFLFHENRLCGWENRKTGEKICIETGEKILDPLAFSGIHVIEPLLVKETTLSGKFSITDFYLEAMRNNKIFAYKHSATLWLDVGAPEKLKEAEKRFSEFV